MNATLIIVVWFLSGGNLAPTAPHTVEVRRGAMYSPAQCDAEAARISQQKRSTTSPQIYAFCVLAPN